MFLHTELFGTWSIKFNYPINDITELGITKVTCNIPTTVAAAYCNHG
jgi:hypothetical protein